MECKVFDGFYFCGSSFLRIYKKQSFPESIWKYVVFADIKRKWIDKLTDNQVYLHVTRQLK